MNVYLAGTSVINPEEALKIQYLFKKGNKLHSYFHIPILEKRWFDMNVKNEVNLFIDSGAFSAWSQNIEIDIYEYAKFIKQHKDIINIYANLDVIGVGGKQPNKLTAEKTLENQRILEAEGLSPIPCFHYGEPDEYLQYYVDNYDYIALGVAGNAGKKLIPWLDRCFLDFICDKNGMPKTKVHGFAVTSLVLMMRYPWYSVDSTSWVVCGRMGSVMVPRRKNGKWRYDANSWKVTVSSRSPGIKDDLTHIQNMPPIKKEIVMDYLNEKGYELGESYFEKVPQDRELGENERWAEKKPKNKKAKRLLEIITVNGIANRYQLRDELNIIYYLDLEKSLPDWPWAFKKKSKLTALL